MGLTFKESQKKVDQWIAQFEEGYWPPLAMFASIVEEVGEFGREINNLEGYKRKRGASSNTLELELGDVMFSLICIANFLKIDIGNAFLKSLDKYSKRDSTRWTTRAK